jgi:hypothetical protein
LLDLGIWMSLQSAVEKHFHGTRNDAKALARKIEETWAVYDSSVFYKVFNRWKLALDLIIADGGDNRLVNSHRGSLFTPAVAPAAGDDDDNNNQLLLQEQQDDDDEDSSIEESGGDDN